MAKPNPSYEYDTLLTAVGHFPNGADIEQIEAALESRPSRRSLQRWLRELIAQGRLLKQGQGRATRYLAGRLVTAGGYNREFLENYRPNVSFYLSESIRSELLAQG